MDANTAFIQKKKDLWLKYSNPAEIIATGDPTRVVAHLARVEESVQSGLYAAGFISYEAASGFDSALVTHEPGSCPVLWFGLYRDVEEFSELPAADGNFHVDDWQATLSEAEYLAAVDKVKTYIKAGDSYQVNVTQRLRAGFQGDPYAFFCALQAAQHGRNAAYIETDTLAICSASPELFLAVKGESLKSCPMKGTMPRGLTAGQDQANKEALKRSEKNRAENVMIVDMIRNDLGRVSEEGSVAVTSSFDVEQYPTVLQMTSTVRGKSRASLTEIMRAMFPCSSITGAPKVRTMEIIHELEPDPRGLYTGTIGCMAPGEPRQALFNVAIRTVVIDKASGRAEYGTGGGVVWDSVAKNEYEECLQKARILTAEMPVFKLLETILWTPGKGYFLLDHHLDRLTASAQYFDFPLDPGDLTTRLLETAATLGDQSHRVRLLVDSSGGIQLETTPIEDPGAEVAMRVCLAAEPVDARDPFLYHKTTHRAVYEKARASAPGVDDVILFNSVGEVTESTIATIVVEREGRRLTPPVSCGLLAGTFRAQLLQTGEIEEATITLEDLQKADRVFLVNSVRKWVPVAVLDNSPPSNEN